MRSHSQIVREYGAAALHRALKGRGRDIHPSTPQRWADRNSIPGAFWSDIVDLGASTLVEMAQAARFGANDISRTVAVAGEGDDPEARQRAA